jgi:hypothetical protein
MLILEYYYIRSVQLVLNKKLIVLVYKYIYVILLLSCIPDNAFLIRNRSYFKNITIL